MHSTAERKAASDSGRLLAALPSASALCDCPKQRLMHTMLATFIPPPNPNTHLHTLLMCSTAKRNTASESGRLLVALWSASASSTAAVALDASCSSE